MLCEVCIHKLQCYLFSLFKVKKNINTSFLEISVWENRLIQGSYGSWKTWKVLESYYEIFQDWKVLEKGHWSCKALEIC